MANYELVFDLGSAYVSAGSKKDGFTDKIPSVVAVSTESKQIVGVGVEAIRLGNTVGSGVKLTHPILEGAVIDTEGAKALISALLNRLVNYKMSAFSRYNVTCAVPCGMISSDKNTIETLFLGLGAKQVNFLETPIADSVYLFNEFRTRQGIVVDIGYDCTDLAIVSANQIAAGCTLYYSGKNLTEVISDRIRSKYMIQLSRDAAEYLKLNCASLYPNDSTVVGVSGTNTQTGVVEQINVSSKELYDTVVEFVRKYAQIIRSLVDSVRSDLATLVHSDGVMLCGGGARLAGLDMFLQSELGLPVYVASYPEDVTIKGLLAL